MRSTVERGSTAAGRRRPLGTSNKKKRKTSLPAAAARLPVAARVAPPCFGPRESGSGDDGATEDDGAKEVNPQAARRRSLKANLPAPAAEPFEGENLPEPFHPSAVPRLLRFLGDGRWCRYVTFREVRSVDDAGVRRRTFRLVAEDRSELDAVVGTDTLDGKYAYETCDELVTQGMDRVGRPFTSPPQPGHLRNARDAAAFCRAVVHASGTAPPAFCTNAADARRSDADVRSILARTDAVDTADTTWRDVEHTLGPKMWRWATGSAGELASARLAEMVRAGGRGYPGRGGAEDADRPGRGRDRIGAEVRVDEDRRRRQHGDARGDRDRAGTRHHRGLPFRGERDERRRRRGGGAMAVDHGEAGGVAGGIRALMSTGGTRCGAVRRYEERERKNDRRTKRRVNIKNGYQTPTAT